MTRPWLNSPAESLQPDLLAEDEECGDLIQEARALQLCLRHLLRDANALHLEQTARMLQAAMSAVEQDLACQIN